MGPKDPIGDMGLLGGMKGRIHHAGHHTSVVCHMGWSPSRHILKSNPRALHASGSHCGRGQLD